MSTNVSGSFQFVVEMGHHILRMAALAWLVVVVEQSRLAQLGSLGMGMMEMGMMETGMMEMGKMEMDELAPMEMGIQCLGFLE